MTHRHPQYAEWSQRWEEHRRKGKSGIGPSRPLTDVSDKLPREHCFETPPELSQQHPAAEISVQEFFRLRYGITLQYPELVLVGFGKGGRNLVPMELCDFVGGEAARLATADERSKLVKETSQPPAQRLEEIRTLQRDVGRDATCRAFGLEVRPLLDNVPGRVLPVMSLGYGPENNPRVAIPEAGGKFRGNWRTPPGATYIRPGNVQRCVVGLFPPSGMDHQHFLDVGGLQRGLSGLIADAGKLGLNLDFGPLVRLEGREVQLQDPSLLMCLRDTSSAEEVEQELARAFGELGDNVLLLAIIPDQNNNARPFLSAAPQRTRLPPSLPFVSRRRGSTPSGRPTRRSARASASRCSTAR